jgi:hypothetical protein
MLGSEVSHTRSHVLCWIFINRVSNCNQDNENHSNTYLSRNSYFVEVPDFFPFSCAGLFFQTYIFSCSWAAHHKIVISFAALIHFSFPVQHEIIFFLFFMPEIPFASL